MISGSIGFAFFANAQSHIQPDTIMARVIGTYSRFPNTEKSFEALLGCAAIESEVTDKAALTEFHFLMAHDLWKLGLQESALNHIQKSIDHSLSAHSDTTEIFLKMGTKIGYYLAMSRSDSALILARDANGIASDLDSIYQAAALNNIGLCHQELHDLEDARSYFDSSLKMIPNQWENHDQLKWLQIAVKDNLAQCFAEKGNYSRAISLVTENIVELEDMHIIDEYWCSKFTEYGLRKARLAIRSGDWQIAQNVSEQLRTFYDQCPEGLSKQDELDILKLEHELAVHDNQTSKERDLNRAILSLTETIDRNNSELQMSSLKRMSAISLDKTKTDYLKSIELIDQKVRFRNYLILLIGLISILGLGTALLTYKLRLQSRKLENQQLQIELQHKNNDLGNLALDISTRKKLTEEMLNYIRELNSSSSPLDLKIVERDLKQQIKADEKREWVHSQVEKINSAFYDRLTSKYPSLAPTELELCAMIRAGMSNKEIAEIRNISPSSASTARYRLRKKLGIEEGDDLNQVLNEV